MSLPLSKRTVALVFLASSASAILIAAFPSGRDARPVLNAPFQPGSAVVMSEPSHPKMEHALSRLYGDFRARGGAAAREFAASRGIDFEAGAVRVAAETASAGSGLPVSAATLVLSARIAALGGTVTSVFRGFVEARIPVASLETLADDPIVAYLRRPLRPRPMTISEGVSRIGADLWRDMDPFHIGGRETRICVLDLGFMGYGNLKGTDLPSDVGVRSFRADRDIAAGEDHGAACAEIIYDVAPGAKMWLANFSTEGEYYDAVNWMLSQKFDVVSYSIGWLNAGDGRGTGPICEAVKRAADNGIIWVGSAGNSARSHFEGTFNDPDGDGWMEFPDGSEFLTYTVPAGETTSAFLNWDDWGTWNSLSYEYSGSSQDYDLYLYVLDRGAWRLMDQSVGAQNGIQWPTEDITDRIWTGTATWGVRIFKKSATRNCKMELFVEGNSGTISNNVPQGSLLVPGDAAGSVTIGAVDWSNDQREPYHTYSSEGPTHDGRIKPDFSAPSGVSTASWGTRNFYGTSAAAPHAAGAVALLRQKTAATLPQVLQILAGRAVDLGDPGKDIVYGAGRVSVKKK